MGYYDSWKKKDRSDFYIDYKFKFKDKKEEYFSYNVPFEDYIAGVVAYFDVNEVGLDGTDNHIFNVLSGLGALDEIEDDEYFIDFVTEKCRAKAQEEFIEEKEEEEEDEEQDEEDEE